MAREGRGITFDPEPWLASCKDDVCVAVAGKAWFYDEDKLVHHCTTMLHGQPFLLKGMQLPTDRFTIVGGVKSTLLGTPLIDARDAVLKGHTMVSNKAVTDVIDVCSGYAVMTAGYRWLNCKVRCHVEINDKYASWLRTTGAHVIEGDIDCIATQQALVPHTKLPCIITGGFSCQPFSQLGDRRQQLDPRARSFEGMLTTCYVHQPMAMILECTKEALDSAWVQGSLQAFCAKTGYTLQQQLCHLQDFWPAKRTRWWAVLVHPMVKMPPLQSFPSLDFKPSFRHLLPKLPLWPESQVQEIRLTAHELEIFAEQPGGLGSNAVCPTKPLATALHAWGSQLQACACGCRAGGFTPKRLEEKGLYGALIPTTGSTIVRGHEIQNMRHVHPDEVAILHMVPTRHLHQGSSRHLRLDLTALGQMASPAQALWHVAQVIQAFGQTFGAPTHPKLAEQGLLQLAIETFAARDELLKPFAHSKESRLFQSAVLAKLGATYEGPIVTVASSAESAREAPSQVSTDHKRKAFAEHVHAADAGPPQGVSPTGGIEFFANKSRKAAHTPDMPSGQEPLLSSSSQVVQTQSVIEATNKGIETSRGKGKGGSVGGHFGVDMIPMARAFKQVPDLDDYDCEPPKWPNDCGAGALQTMPVDPRFDTAPKEHLEQGKQFEDSLEEGPLGQFTAPTGSSELAKSDLLKLMPSDQFHVTVCCKGNQPVHVTVCPGTTVGQLSQAEEGLASFVQPIVITTMTGVPLPLSSWLTPSTWYVVDNGAKHVVPRCADVHAEPFRYLTLTCLDRFQGLLTQGPLVAVDEMKFYASMVRHQGYQVADPVVVDDLGNQAQELATWVLQALHAHECDVDQRLFMVPVLVQSHWFPAVLRVLPDCNQLSVPHEVARQVQEWITQSCGPYEVSVTAFTMPTVFAADCGFQTLNWFFAQVVGTCHPKAVTPAQADNWRVLFANHVLKVDQVPSHRIRLGGTLSPDQLLLQSVLAQHGVDKDRLATCATHLIQQLGLEDINKALQSSQPWRDLKALASQASPPIRIVLASEIDAAVKARLASKKPMGSKANKTKGHKGQRQHVIPTADQIKLPDGIFVQQDGQKLAAIPIHKVEAHAQGVAVCNIHEVQHLLSLAGPISSEGVALLILEHDDPSLPPKTEQIRIPAMSAATSEPMLVSAAMLQLGSKPVTRHVPTESFALEEIKTQVLKVLVYQDEWPGQWKAFLQHPVKAIFEHALLQDAALPQSENVMDVWDRQTLDSKLARTQLSQAEIFAVQIRVTEHLASHLLPSAGVDGVYFEPRTMDGRKPDPLYRVIWMPRKNLAQVRLARSQTEPKTHIVRMGARYGLRVDHEQAEQVHQQHRPDLLFLNGHELRPYKVGPFPYGSTKASISMAFKHLGWHARPVQPISQMQVHEGIFWQVMAPQEPTHWIYQLKHGDILIAKIDDHKDSTMPSTNNIIASKKTITTLSQRQQEGTPDPWLRNDPWQASHASHKQTPAAPAQGVSPGQLLALEQRLEQKIQASASEPKEEPMQIDHVARIDALEHQMQTLTSNFSSFQSQQVKVNHQLAHQLQGFEGRIDARLDDQMQRIEALLSKKMRHE